jgi:hypothetical protein
MNIAIISVLVGFLSLAAVLFFLKGAMKAPSNLANLRKQMRALDIEAFRNLIDSEEEKFLRDNLHPAQFRQVQRARIRAAVEYIECASRNAVILHRFGEAARHSPTASVAEAGEKLVNSAIRFRLYSLQAIVTLYLAMIMPEIGIHGLRITEGYERMTTLVTLLGCLQYQAPDVSVMSLAS